MAARLHRKFLDELVKLNNKHMGVLFSEFKILPNFLIIGAQKSGTTSLYLYLRNHPFIISPFEKEIHYFDLNFDKSLRWYKSFFPSIFHRYYKNIFSKKELLTGEATPFYLFHPHVPKRVFSLLPDAKLIVLLRNPIDRAYSHYNMNKRYGIEDLSFMEAIKKEKERINPDYLKMLKNENYNGYNFQNFSYLNRGIYFKQLERWFKFFPKEQIKIIQSEKFFRNPKKLTNKVFDFLNITKYNNINFKTHWSGNYNNMEKKIKKQLNKFFKPHNKALYNFLGRDFGWE